MTLSESSSGTCYPGTKQHKKSSRGTQRKVAGGIRCVVSEIKKHMRKQKQSSELLFELFRLYGYTGLLNSVKCICLEVYTYCTASCVLGSKMKTKKKVEEKKNDQKVRRFLSKSDHKRLTAWSQNLIVLQQRGVFYGRLSSSR